MSTVHEPLLASPAATTISTSTTSTAADPLDQPAPKCCWCLPLDRFLCWHSHPMQLRALDLISQVVFWHSGMYNSGSFNRARWERVDSMNRGFPGVDGATSTASYDMDIPGEHAAVIPIRVYEGHSDAAQLPVFVYYHGGGFAIGGREMKNFHILCNKIAALGFVVVAVSYRLAPEHPFPAAIEDAYDVLKWVSDASLSQALLPARADRTRIVVGGDSAGGNLSAVLGSLTRDGLNASLQPEPREIRIARLVLIYPALFHSLDLLDQGEDGMFISKPVTTWFMQAYLPDTDIVALSKTDRRLAPMIAGLHGLPPTTLISAGQDMLRHENRVAVQMLREANVPVTHHHFEGVPHGFATFHFLPEAELAFGQLARDLKAHIL